MRLPVKLSDFVKARAKQKYAWQQKRIRTVAYQLYQKRMKSNSSGDSDRDWAVAKCIVSNPVRLSAYATKRSVVSLLAAQNKWFFSGLKDKSSWEWLKLLIIPLFLSVGAFYLENRVERRQEDIAALRYERDQMIASERYEQELLIAADRNNQETLNSYFAQMKELLLTDELRNSPEGSEVRNVARAITATTIKSLNGERNSLLLRFLRESNLIFRKQWRGNIFDGEPLQLLSGLDLQGASLVSANFSYADLSGTSFDYSDLIEADFSYAKLSHTGLSDADLSGASFFYADLNETFFVQSDLSWTRWQGAVLSRMNLAGVNLRSSIFKDVDLSEISLKGADFTYADLSEATLSDDNFEQLMMEGSVLCKTKLPELPKGFSIDPDRDCEAEEEWSVE